MTATLFDVEPFTVPVPVKAVHPAKFSDPILDRVRPLVEGLRPLLDPFAGTGKVHLLGGDTWGVEIEKPWADLHERTIHGNSRHLSDLFEPGFFAAVVTSPTYGNRLADKHTAKDGSVRHSYTHDIRAQTGDESYSLDPDNSGGMQWGDAYRELHLAVWEQVAVVLRPGGTFVCNVSDHIRDRKVVEVCAWHRDVIPGLGFELVAVFEVGTARLKFGANSERVPAEEVQVYRRLAG